MHSEAYDQWFKLNKNLILPFSDLARATSEIARRTTQQELAIIGENLSLVSDQLLRLSHVKKPEELFLLQKECLNEGVSLALENTQKLMRITMENMEEFSKIFSSLHEHNPITAAAKSAERAAERATEKTERHK